MDEAKAEIAQKLIAETQLDEKFQKIEESLSKKETSAVESQIKAWNISWDETGEFDLQAESIPKLLRCCWNKNNEKTALE